jgi:2-methylisocitrate lyase-like PEP mutase family enzyme
MPAPADARIRAFHALHHAGCFVMPNPWDPGSARLLAALGFPALATTSAGMAWALGRRDNAVSRDEVLAHLAAMTAAVEVPVNADFEGGFAVAPDGVAANVRLAAATGIAGLSIEDSTGDPSAPLFDRGLAVERVRAAREALDASGRGVLLTARSEGFFVGRPDLDETVARLAAYAEAGAECLYAPGITTPEQIAAVVAAVAPKPVNLLVHGPFITVADAAALGVRRISVGGALARVAWAGLLTAAGEIAGQGTFGALAGGVSSSVLNARLGGD